MNRIIPYLTLTLAAFHLNAYSSEEKKKCNDDAQSLVNTKIISAQSTRKVTGLITHFNKKLNQCLVKIDLAQNSTSTQPQPNKDEVLTIMFSVTLGTELGVCWTAHKDAPPVSCQIAHSGDRNNMSTNLTLEQWNTSARSLLKD